MKAKSFLQAAKLTAVILFLLALLFLAVYFRFTSFFDVKAFNKNSDTDVFLCAEADKIPDTYKEYNDGFFGFRMYRSESGSTELKTSSFPDAVIGKSKVTGIYLKENNTDGNILGIKIGDDDSVAYKQLEKYKFKNINASNDRITAEKNKIRIRISLGDNYEVKEISVTLDTTNIFKIQY